MRQVELLFYSINFIYSTDWNTISRRVNIKKWVGAHAIAAGGGLAECKRYMYVDYYVKSLDIKVYYFSALTFALSRCYSLLAHHQTRHYPNISPRQKTTAGALELIFVLYVIQNCVACFATLFITNAVMDVTLQRPRWCQETHEPNSSSKIQVSKKLIA